MWQRFRKHFLGMSGLIYVLFCVCVAVFAPLLVTDDSPNANRQAPALAKLPPNSHAVEQVGNITHARYFLLGTDDLGRDVYSRLVLGTRISLLVGMGALCVSLLLGTLLGLLAGYFGGWLDAFLRWILSVMWALPTLLLALSLSFVLGKGVWQLVLSIGLSSWVDVARMVRGQVLGVRTLTYIEATRALGIPQGRVLARHIFPNITAPLITVAVANFGNAVLLESGLSFLGIGVPADTPTWGRMVAEGYAYIVFSHGYWLAMVPGIALMLLIIAINFIGIGLNDAGERA